MLLWSKTVVEKFELSEICKRYDAAPVDAFQLKVGFVDIPVELFDGCDNCGAEGIVTGSMIAVNQKSTLWVPLS